MSNLKEAEFEGGGVIYGGSIKGGYGLESLRGRGGWSIWESGVGVPGRGVYKGELRWVPSGGLSNLILMYLNKLSPK